ncbi:MAG: efflux RND transporter periplasmic adaptor subunit [Chromatiales bacterium]|jgi:RND family efflux transporter MFP subunit
MKPLVLAFLALAVVVPVHGAELIALTPEQRDALGIRFEPLEPAGSVAGKGYPAEVVVPNDRLRVVSAPTQGVVQSLHVAEGEHVDADQPLATLNSPDLIARQRDLLEARTRHDLAAANYRRDRQLHEEGIIAERRLLESRAAYQETRATLAQRRQVLELAGMDPEDIDALERSGELSPALVVRAPLAGVVLEQMATAGQRLAAAEPIYRIGDLSVLWVEVHVPLDELGDARPGDRLTLPQESVSGRVITVGRMVHGADQGVLVRAAVAEDTARLRPGQFVQARVESAAADQRLRAPVGSVVRSGGRAFVFVETGAGLAATPVDIVAQGPDGTVIQGDLEPGSRVVAEGTAAVKAVWLGGGE